MSNSGRSRGGRKIVIIVTLVFVAIALAALLVPIPDGTGGSRFLFDALLP